MLLLGVLMWLFISRHIARSRHKALLTGKVLAPGVGPETTLLISDIQDSTLLWWVTAAIPGRSLAGSEWRLDWKAYLLQGMCIYLKNHGLLLHGPLPLFLLTSSSCFDVTPYCPCCMLRF